METIYYPVTTLKNTSPGSIMFVINLIMVFVFSAIIFTSGLVFYFLAGDFSADTGFIIWTALLLVCCSEIIVCFVGLRGSYLVSLDILINYFWGVSVLIVPLCITIYGSYNYLENAQLYAEHQWTHDSFDNARKIFCDPPDTYKTECMVPFKGPDNQFGMCMCVCAHHTQYIVCIFYIYPLVVCICHTYPLVVCMCYIYPLIDISLSCTQ